MDRISRSRSNSFGSQLPIGSQDQQGMTEAQQSGGKRKDPPLTYVSGSKRPHWIKDLMSLPNELLLAVVGKLDDTKDISAVRQTNRRLDNLVGLEHVTELSFKDSVELGQAANAFAVRNHLHKICKITLVGTQVKAAHLDSLRRFTALNELHFVNCDGLTAACGPKIPDGIKKLNFTNCKKTMQPFLSKLSSAMKLEELSFVRCRGLTNACAPSLTRFRGSKRLEFKECIQISNDFVEQLFPISDEEEANLAPKELRFAHCMQITDDVAPIFSRLNGLQKLCVAGCSIDDRFVAGIFPPNPTNPTLEALDLSWTNVSDTCAPDISRFGNLNKLYVFSCDNLTNRFLAQLFHGVNGDDIPLVSLNLGLCNQLTNDCATDISRFRKLEWLDAECWKLTDDFVERLPSHLKGLRLSYGQGISSAVREQFPTFDVEDLAFK